jgi:uncharacterized protein
MVAVANEQVNVSSTPTVVQTGSGGWMSTAANTLRQYGNWPAVGGGGVFLLLLYSAWRYHARRKVRNCPQCGRAMQRLDEMTDDSFLDAGQKLEEHLGSVDYDVWRCSACKTTIKLPYKSFFTSYETCPKCGKRTLEDKQEVQQAATYTASGVMRIIEDCRHCHHHQERTETIPRKERGSSSSSSSSFGGGRSSGGGASGRW